MAAGISLLVGSGVNLATQLYLQSQQKDNTQAIMDAADPFRGQRGQYQTQLQQLMNGNFSPSNPAYNFRMTQGNENINRGAAQAGLTGSGAQLAQLQDFGQKSASQEYENQYKRLAELSGVNAGSPSAASDALQQQQNRQNAGFGAIGAFAGQLASAGVNGLESMPNSPTMPTDYGNTSGLVSSNSNTLVSGNGSMTSTNYNYDN